MVHALHEANRVLKPGGVLIDLRPAPVHRRVGIEVHGDFKLVAKMNEKFDEDHAANRAVAEVINEGILKPQSRSRFDCKRVMGSLNDFHLWMDDFIVTAGLPSQESLIQKVERAYKSTLGRKRIVVRAPLILRVLRKR
jgi:hypothetical protein